MKKVLYLLLIVFMLNFTACVKKDNKEAEKPVEDVNFLLDKYDVAQQEKESESESKAEGETIDYDKLDEELINEIVANGGTVSEGKAGVGSTNPQAQGVIDMGRMSLDIGNYTFSSQNDDGTRLYIDYSTGSVIAISYADYSNAASVDIEMAKNVYASQLKARYGEYSNCSIFTNANGYTFNKYEYYNLPSLEGFDFQIYVCFTNNCGMSIAGVPDGDNSQLMKLINSISFR